jgi:hypothetical protein
MMGELEEKMKDNMKNLDAESFIKTWMPMTLENWTDVQKMFWQQMGVSGYNTGAPESGDKPPTGKKD